MVLLNFRDAFLYHEDVQLFHGSGWLNEACINFAFRVLEADYEVLLARAGAGAGSNAAPTSDVVHLMDPSVVSWVHFQLEEGEESADFVRDSSLLHKPWLLLPVNDASSLLESGSHWSLLALDVRNMGSTSTSTGGTGRGGRGGTVGAGGVRGYHFDPMSGHNEAAAASVFAAITRALDCGRAAATVTTTVAASAASTASAASAAGASASGHMLWHMGALCPQQADGHSCGVYVVLFADYLAKLVLSESSAAASDASATAAEDSATAAAATAAASDGGLDAYCAGESGGDCSGSSKGVKCGWKASTDTHWLRGMRQAVTPSSAARFRADIVVEVETLCAAVKK